MKILIVDDSSDKIGSILNALRGLDGFNANNVEHVLDLNQARRKLTVEFYDLVILDLNMPDEIGNPPSLKAGTDFMDEIMRTRNIKKPIDLIILTAFDESAKAFREEVEHAGFIVLQYDPLSSEWADVLKSRVDYLMLCQTQRRIIPKPPECDFVILTAVPVETNAVLNLNLDWKIVSLPNDPTVYHHATTTLSGQKVHLIHAQQSEMGMTAAAAITTKIISHFNPKYIIMTGIAAGLDESFHLGDIMVGTDIWNYSSGKYVESGDAQDECRVILAPDSKHLPLSQTLHNLLANINYDEALKHINNEYHLKLPVSDNLRVHFGPIACGVAVVASQKIVHEQIKAHSRKTIGLDMESYGVCYASQTTTSSPVPTIIIKSISDLANVAKDDSAQEYAAYTSARFALHLIETLFTS